MRRNNHVQLSLHGYRVRPLFVYILAVVVGLLVGTLIGYYGFKEEPLLSPVPSTLDYLEVPQVYAAESTPSPQKVDKVGTYTGKASSYSHAGCLGCSKNQTTGNGDKFDENAMTLAVPCEKIKSKELKYNTNVIVTNLDNGKSVQAKITDCGGFSKYDRIADLSKGLAQKLGSKSNNWKKPPTQENGSNIKMEILP